MSAFERLLSGCAIAAILTFASPIGAAEKDPPQFANLDWRTQALPADINARPLLIDDKTPLLFSRIIPANSFKSPSDMDTGANAIPSGAAITRTASNPERYCEPMRRRKQPQIYCVADTDGNGTLDVLYVIPTFSILKNSAYWSTVENYEFLIGTMRLYSGRPLKVPVAKLALIPDLEPAPLDIMFTKISKTRFSLCISRYTGSRLIDGLGNAAFCGREWDVKNAALPVVLEYNGGNINLSKTKDGRYQAFITPPPPGINFPNGQ